MLATPRGSGLRTASVGQALDPTGLLASPSRPRFDLACIDGTGGRGVPRLSRSITARARCLPSPSLGALFAAVFRLDPSIAPRDGIGPTGPERSGASPMTPDRGAHSYRLRLPRVRGRCGPAWRRARSITARVKSRGPLCFPSSVYGKARSSAGASGQSPMHRSASMEPRTASSAPSASMWVRRSPHRTTHQPCHTASVTGLLQRRDAARPPPAR